MTVYAKHKPDLSMIEEITELNPEAQVVGLGYTPANFKKILNLLGKELSDSVLASVEIDDKESANAKNNTKDLDYIKYEKLLAAAQKILSKKGIDLRDEMPDFGYSPYNLAVIHADTGLHQPDFAKLLGISVVDLRRNLATMTSFTHFEAMPSDTWSYVLTVYLQALLAVDKRLRKRRTAQNRVFTEVSTGRALRSPTIEISA